MRKIKDLHEAAAEQLERAAAHHRMAAEHLDDGEQESAAHHATLAIGHTLNGHEHAVNATKAYIELHEEAMEA
jgi:hypothetical protein